MEDEPKTRPPTYVRLREASQDIDINTIDFFRKPQSTGQRRSPTRRSKTFSNTSSTFPRTGGNRSKSMLAGVRPRTLLYKKDNEDIESGLLLSRGIRMQSKVDEVEEEGNEYGRDGVPERFGMNVQ